MPAEEELVAEQIKDKGKGLTQNEGLGMKTQPGLEAISVAQVKTDENPEI